METTGHERENFFAAEHAEDAMGTILETLGSARWTIYADEKGKIQAVRWSDEMRRLLGYHGEDEFPDTLKAYYERIHPDDFSEAFRKMWDALRDISGSVKYDIEYRLRGKNGKYHWFRAVGRYASHTDDKRVRIFYGLLLAIDEQKRQQDRIQQNLRVMSVLNQEYTAVYYVDLDEDSYTSYLNNGTTNESASEFVQSQGVYSSTIAQCIVALVAEEDRDWLAEMLDIRALKKRLEKEKEFFIRYHASLNLNGQVHFEIKLVDSSPSKRQHQVVMGFHCIDEQVKKEEEMKQKMEEEHRERDYQKLLILHHALRSSMWGFDFDREGSLLGMDFGEDFRVMAGFQADDTDITFEKCFARVHPQDRQRVIDSANDILKHHSEEMQYAGEFRMKHQDGKYRWFHVSGKVFQRSETLYSFVAVFTDVNEEKTLEMSLSEEVVQLEKTRDELKKALEEANLNNEIISTIGKIYWLIYRMDLRTDTYEEISSGEEVHRLTGKHGKTTEVFQEVCADVVSEEYQKIMRDFLDMSTLSERLRTEETISVEYLSANGTWHMGRFIVKKRGKNNKVETVLYVVHEIDRRKKRELEYQRKLQETAEEADRANIAKTDFLRRMSHDIRTPINGIRGMVEIENHYANDVEKLQECRDKIWEASGYLLSLVNSVLDMNKLESGNIILEEEAFDIFQLLTEVRTVVGIQAGEKGVYFQPDDLQKNIKHRYLIGSPTYLKQILMNVAGNAVKYTKEQGKVQVRCSELSANYTESVFQFICEDTGIGMSREFQEHAFEPFSQEKKDARSTFSGSGLGLSITKNLVEYMGGTITLSSEEQVGTTFIITIPLKINRNPSKEKPEIDMESLKGKKVLLVEDNELNMEIARFMLEKHGLLIREACNGKDAVESFASSEIGEFDLIFMDIMMPVMNGLEATRQIRSLDRADAKSVPIFAMTANAFKEDIRASVQAGMNEHLTKPLDENRIVRTMRKYVGC